LFQTNSPINQNLKTFPATSQTVGAIHESPVTDKTKMLTNCKIITIFAQFQKKFKKVEEFFEENGY
ncbi:MAG: hypothetical protein J6S23_03325, partial [Clostridia bacterium]|nr:hypothetical protein [Clostridia bacterium]